MDSPTGTSQFLFHSLHNIVWITDIFIDHVQYLVSPAGIVQMIPQRAVLRLFVGTLFFMLPNPSTGESQLVWQHVLLHEYRYQHSFYAPSPTGDLVQLMYVPQMRHTYYYHRFGFMQTLMGDLQPHWWPIQTTQEFHGSLVYHFPDWEPGDDEILEHPLSAYTYPTRRTENSRFLHRFKRIVNKVVLPNRIQVLNFLFLMLDDFFS